VLRLTSLAKPTCKGSGKIAGSGKPRSIEELESLGRITSFERNTYGLKNTEAFLWMTLTHDGEFRGQTDYSLKNMDHPKDSLEK